MPSQVHAIAAIIHRLGNSTDLVVGLKNDGRNIRAPQKFESSGQARGSGSGR